MNKINKVLSFPFIALVKLYKRFISPYKSPSCRFTPTCSSYAIGALEEWGPIAGLALALWRVLRCNPFSAGGYDPVPLRKKHRKRDARTEDAADDDPV
ncbi:MAG: membrane protein insertion efficiency factor YidD [Clostridia bacterium]|nr:membrane protein insertion efficiency factor YidD [Clostridia bacterium]